MYVDSVHVFPFRQPTAGHMVLPNGDPVAVPQYMWATMDGRYGGNTRYPFITFILNIFM